MSNHAGAVPTWLTSTYMEGVLRTVVKDENITIVDLNITPGSSVGDNYVCQIFRLKATFLQAKQERRITLIGKVLPDTELAQQLNSNSDMFGVEVSSLSKTLPELYRMYPNAKRFSPKMYHLDEGNKMIYLEDLNELGYRMKPKGTRLLDMAHSKLMVQALATMHAHAYLLIQQQPQLKQQYSANAWNKEGIFRVLVESCVASIFNALNDWPIPEQQKTKLRNLRSCFYDRQRENYQRREGAFNTLLHGDCSVNNVLFKYNSNDAVVDCILVDFQLVNYNSIGLDLNYFIFMSSEVATSPEGIDKLLQDYYATFVAVTGNVQGFSFETVRKEFDSKLLFGFSCSLCFRPAMISPGDFDLDSMSNSDITKANDAVYSSPRLMDDVKKIFAYMEKRYVL